MSLRRWKKLISSKDYQDQQNGVHPWYHGQYRRVIRSSASWASQGSKETLLHLHHKGVHTFGSLTPDTRVPWCMWTLVNKKWLMYDDHWVVPVDIREEILECIHTGHQGITKCHKRANLSVWWPGISKESKAKLRVSSRCHFCQQNQPSQRKELMTGHSRRCLQICLS